MRLSGPETHQQALLDGPYCGSKQPLIAIGIWVQTQLQLLEAICQIMSLHIPVQSCTESRSVVRKYCCRVRFMMGCQCGRNDTCAKSTGVCNRRWAVTACHGVAAVVTQVQCTLPSCQRESTGLEARQVTSKSRCRKRVQSLPRATGKTSIPCETRGRR